MYSDDVKSIDLSLTISESIPTFPGSPKPQFIAWSNIKDDGYNLELLFLSSHTGTHLDAPYHFAKNGLKINQIPLDRLIGKAILIKLKKLGIPLLQSQILHYLKKRMEKSQIIHQSFSTLNGKKI